VFCVALSGSSGIGALFPATAFATPVGTELPAVRAGYAGFEVTTRIAKSTPGEVAPMIALGPTFEVSITPRWSVAVHGGYAVGLAAALPKNWWALGGRGVYRPTDAQAVWLGAGIGSPDEFFVGRYEDVAPQLELGGMIWEFDADPVRFGPMLELGLTAPEGSYFVGLGISGQIGFGPIRAKGPPFWAASDRP
jgi:hypothetical protein